MKSNAVRIGLVVAVVTTVSLAGCGDEPEGDNDDEAAVLAPGWHSTSMVDSPDPRNAHLAVWTGDQKIVWGGYGGEYFVDGAKYDPEANEWERMTTEGAPEGRVNATAVWTGEEMIVWGGAFYDEAGDFHALSDGARYSPEEDRWSPVAESPVDGRAVHAAVWTGEEMIVWGGVNQDAEWLDDGAAYDPEADEWHAIEGPDDYVPRRTQYSGVWTGEEMIVWGGVGDDEPVDDGWRYAPGEDEWTKMAAVPDDIGSRAEFGAVWAGEQMVVWGGVANYEAGEFAPGGAVYDPDDDSWESIGVSDELVDNQAGATGVWTGREAIFWGGWGGPQETGSSGAGVRIVVEDRQADLMAESRPTPRYQHSAVWTGAEMLIFGGVLDIGAEDVWDLGDGWLYVP